MYIYLTNIQSHVCIQYITYFTSWLLPSNFIGKIVIYKIKSTKRWACAGQVQHKPVQHLTWAMQFQSNNTDEQRGSWEDVKTKCITPSWKRGTSCGESFTDNLIGDSDVRPVVSGLVGNINLLGRHMHRCTAGHLRWCHAHAFEYKWGNEAALRSLRPYSPLLNLLMVLLCCSMVLWSSFISACSFSVCKLTWGTCFRNYQLRNSIRHCYFGILLGSAIPQVSKASFQADLLFINRLKKHALQSKPPFTAIKPDWARFE